MEIGSRFAGSRNTTDAISAAQLRCRLCGRRWWSGVSVSYTHLPRRPARLLLVLLCAQILLMAGVGHAAMSEGGRGVVPVSYTHLPGALGGLAGLLVASKSSRKLLAKYGTSALLVGGGAVAGSVLCIGGSWLVPADALEVGDYDRITKIAREAVEGAK